MCKTASGIDNQKWAFRVIKAYVDMGVRSGPVLRVAGKTLGAKMKRSKMGGLDPPFHNILRRVQER
jgi:hypothetical protein